MKRPTRQSGNRDEIAVPVSDMRSSDDVGNDAVGNQLDFVFQRQLLLLHPGELKLVAVAGRAKQLDFLIQAAVLRLEKLQNLPRIIVIHAPVLQEARPAVTHRRVNGEPLGEQAVP
jgi:hypothetical protein